MVVYEYGFGGCGPVVANTGLKPAVFSGQVGV